MRGASICLIYDGAVELGAGKENITSAHSLSYALAISNWKAGGTGESDDALFLAPASNNRPTVSPT